MNILSFQGVTSHEREKVQALVTGYGTIYVSAAHTDAGIDDTLEAAGEVRGEMRAEGIL